MYVKEEADVLNQIKKELPKYIPTKNKDGVNNVGTFFYIEVSDRFRPLPDVIADIKFKYRIKISVLAYCKQRPDTRKKYGFAMFSGSKETTAALKGFLPSSRVHFDKYEWVWHCQSGEEMFILKELPALEEMVKVVTNSL